MSSITDPPPPVATGPRIGATSRAATSATTDMTANTTPAPTEPSRRPASAGAASRLALSIQPATTFAAVSSSGVRASDGVRTACAGRVTVTAVAAIAAQA